MEDVDHDGLQLAVHFLEAPAQALGVLAHFQSGGGHAAGVGSLAGAEQQAAAASSIETLAITEIFCVAAGIAIALMLPKIRKK